MKGGGVNDVLCSSYFLFSSGYFVSPPREYRILLAISRRIVPYPDRGAMEGITCAARILRLIKRSRPITTHESLVDCDFRIPSASVALASSESLDHQGQRSWQWATAIDAVAVGVI